jgi:hypothetical protein
MANNRDRLMAFGTTLRIGLIDSCFPPSQKGQSVKDQSRNLRDGFHQAYSAVVEYPYASGRMQFC